MDENYLKGSEWRRWDLHLHTPFTKKNDSFNGNTLEKKWENFYSYINDYINDGLDPQKNIATIGITDYLSVDNYKKVILDNRLPATIKLVLPNVEIRMLPVAKQTGINLHFIFDPSVVSELDEIFFSQLSFRHGSTNYNATKSQLIKLGKAIVPNQNCDDKDLLSGISAFYPTMDSIRQIFEKNPALREKTIIAVSNSSNDGVSGATNHACYFNEETGKSDLDATRQSIYQFADAIFSANPTDISYFLGESMDNVETVKEKCNSLKPCIHGCDAHCLEKIFEPNEHRYCWIKADPTFNGLRQIIFEPKERVRISQVQPEVKPLYFTINHVIIDDADFAKEPIYFNDKLTCIIGGKSTGKSILLHNLALAIDEKQVNAKLETTKSNLRIIDKIKVVWSDNEESSHFYNDDKHKIVYIPQTYLNRLSDEKEEMTEIDKIISDIVLLNTDAKHVFDNTQTILKDYKPQLDKYIYDLIENHKKLLDLVAQKKELGTKNGIEKQIGVLKNQKDEISKSLDLSQKDIENYDFALIELGNLEKQIGDLKLQITTLNSIESLVEERIFNYILNDELTHKLSQITSDTKIIADEYWKKQKEKLIDDLLKHKTALELKQANSLAIKESLSEKMCNNEVLNKLSKNVLLETIKLDNFIKLDNEYAIAEKEFNRLLALVVNSMYFYKSQHENYAKEINMNTSLATSDLEFSVSVPFRKDAFCDKLRQLTDNRTLKKMLNLDDFNQEQYNEKNMHNIISDIINSKLPLVKNHTIESALRDICSDWYNTTYSVKMDDDAIDVMSPGKKALVLLKLLISLAECKCPILIDQPEDDLDNRSIYDDLISFIKSKKQERQIIVVTHNANMVLGSDAEEIIVANQSGNNSPNNEFRFEYRSGSIENNVSILDINGKSSRGILDSQGIQQHICDILEGGQKAFDLRKNKYHM